MKHSIAIGDPRAPGHPDLPSGRVDIVPARLVSEEDGVRLQLRSGSQKVIVALSEREALAVANGLVDQVMRIRASGRQG